MLVYASKLIFCPILSLHTGEEIARVSDLIIDPNSLELVGLKVEGRSFSSANILPVRSIREFSNLGIIIDSVDELVEADDIIRIKDILSLRFVLNGHKVVTESAAKLGKVTDFTLSTVDWRVLQLIVARPLAKSFFDPELTIARSEIIEVDDSRVVVKSEYDNLPAADPAELLQNFVNPFRKSDLAAEKLRQNSAPSSPSSPSSR